MLKELIGSIFFYALPSIAQYTQNAFSLLQWIPENISFFDHKTIK